MSRGWLVIMVDAIVISIILIFFVILIGLLCILFIGSLAEFYDRNEWKWVFISLIISPLLAGIILVAGGMLSLNIVGGVVGNE